MIKKLNINLEIRLLRIWKSDNLLYLFFSVTIKFDLHDQYKKYK